MNKPWWSGRGSRNAGLALAIAAGLGACGDGLSGPPEPTELVLLDGGDQVQPAGVKLFDPVEVQAQNPRGAVRGVAVRFEVASGGGQVSPDTATTDRKGRASTRWTLGGLLGARAQTLRVTSGSAPALTVAATAVVGPPGILAAVAGNSQVAMVGRPVAIPPRVRLTDAFLNPIAGDTVTFRQLYGVIGPRGAVLTDTVAITGPDGAAALGGWTLGADAGPHRIRASAADLTADFVAFGTPAAIVLVEGDGQQANAGTLVPVRPAVLALGGNAEPLRGAVVDWAVVGGGGSRVGGATFSEADGIARVTGWILGVEPGPNTLAASVPGLPSIVFTATGVAAFPALVSAVGPTGFSGMLGNFLARVPAARVTDSTGRPVAGATVVFVAEPGAGTVVGAARGTDFDGRAAPLGWRLGPSATTQSVHATVGSLAPATFQATATSPPPPRFNIEVRVGGGPTPTHMAAFAAAVDRWQQVILGDLPEVPLALEGSTCFPALNETVDDLLIFAELTEMDGPGGALASGGPCLVRLIFTGFGNDVGLPIVGRIKVDAADLDSLERTDHLRDVIAHEIGHVLGIGTLWEPMRLIKGAGGPDPLFTGRSAQVAFLDAAGPAGFAGGIVPVENMGGPGRQDAHWRELVMGNELMTSRLNPGKQLLSAITATSLRDQGYLVDDSQSDSYSLPALLTTLGAPAILLREVPLPGPIYLVSPRGIITGSVPR